MNRFDWKMRVFCKITWILLVVMVFSVGCRTIGWGKSDDGRASEKVWCFVSTPDFFNFDVPNPWPQWEDAVAWYFEQIKAENPDFVLVAGDTVNGHWWDGEKCVEQMSALYFEGWKRRMEDAGLKYYVAVGDHEMGDDPWPPEKVEVVPFLEKAFAEHYLMPDNGPKSRKRLAYYVRHKNALLVTVDTFEVVDGVMHVDVMGEQLEWLKKVFTENSDARHIIVQGHVPIYGPAASRSSSELYMGGGEDSEFWRLMREAGVDVYLCGEFHDVTVTESDGIWHIVHGSSWGREIVNTQDYLVCKVYPDRLELQMKSFPMEAKGGHMWNLHKDRGPRDIVEISEETKKKGPQVTGTVTIQKTDNGKEFLNCSGVFEGIKRKEEQASETVEITGSADGGGTFDFGNSTPLEFIEMLKDMKDKSLTSYTVMGIYKDWPRQEHIPALIELLDSQEPCANVMMAISSFIDRDMSTVGTEAAFLIEGFRQKRFPPALNSTRIDINKEELKHWWAEYSKRNN